MLISSFDSKRNSLNLRFFDSFVFFQATWGVKVWLGGSFYSKLAALKHGVFCGACRVSELQFCLPTGPGSAGTEKNGKIIALPGQLGVFKQFDSQALLGGDFGWSNSTKKWGTFWLTWWSHQAWIAVHPGLVIAAPMWNYGVPYVLFPADLTAWNWSSHLRRLLQS